MAGSGGAVTILYHHILWYTTTGRGQQCSLLQWPDLYSLSFSFSLCAVFYTQLLYPSTPILIPYSVLPLRHRCFFFFLFLLLSLLGCLLFFFSFQLSPNSTIPISSLSLPLSPLAVTNSNADPRVANRFRCRTASNQPSNTIWKSSLANLLSLITADR